MIGQAYMNPTAYGDLHGLNYAVWYVCMLFADLKFMSIFSMLFGAGVLLMTSRIEASGRRSGPIHYRRMGWLALFGCLHGYLLWTGDILFTYALERDGSLPVAQMAAQDADHLRTAVYGGVVGACLWEATRRCPTGRRSQSIRCARTCGCHRRHTLTKDLAVHRAGWLGEEKARAIENLGNQIQGNIFLAFWRAYGLMLVGMGLFKLGVFSARAPARVYGWFIALGAFCGHAHHRLRRAPGVCPSLGSSPELFSRLPVQLLGELPGLSLLDRAGDAHLPERMATRACGGG